MRNILIQFNVIFIKIESDSIYVENSLTKYMACSISGLLQTNKIYTYDEIIKQYPNIRQVDNFLELKEVYEK